MYFDEELLVKIDVNIYHKFFGLKKVACNNLPIKLVGEKLKEK